MARRRGRKSKKTYQTRVTRYSKHRLRSGSWYSNLTSAYTPSSQTRRGHSSNPKTIKKVTRSSIGVIPNPITTTTKRKTIKSPFGNLNRFPPQITRKALICAKRQQRKEVLHANKQTGKSGQKRPIRTQNSNIHCKG